MLCLFSIVGWNQTRVSAALNKLRESTQKLLPFALDRKFLTEVPGDTPAASIESAVSGDDCGGEQFLVYGPQFGLSNQIVALRNAVVWALLLNRTLVVPHLTGHVSEEKHLAGHSSAVRVPHGHLFDLGRIRAAQLRPRRHP